MDYNNNQDNHYDELQFSLLKAAQIGNINLMLDFIIKGADAFAPDEKGLSPFMYAAKVEPEKIRILFLGLSNYINSKKRGDFNSCKQVRLVRKK